VDSLQVYQLLRQFVIPSPSHTHPDSFLYITPVINTRVFLHKDINGYRNLQIRTSLEIMLSKLCFVSRKISSDIFSYTIQATCTKQGNTHSISRSMGTIVSLHSQKEYAHQPLHITTHTIKLLVNQFTNQTFVLKKKVNYIMAATDHLESILQQKTD